MGKKKKKTIIILAINLLLVNIIVLGFLFPIKDVLNKFRDPNSDEIVNEQDNLDDDEIVQIGDKNVSQEEKGEDEKVGGIGEIAGVNPSTHKNNGGSNSGNESNSGNGSSNEDAGKDDEKDDEEVTIIDNGIDNDVIDAWDDSGW